MEYPKIHSLWKRQGWYFDQKLKKECSPELQQNRQSFIIGDYACEEFGNIKEWDVEEKIDGTNIRIFYKDGEVRFGGRTKDAQIPTHLLDYLQSTFTPSLLNARFADKAGVGTQVLLFGEGYGPKIQSGTYYSEKVGFCLFDVKVGNWWLEKSLIRSDMAPSLGIRSPPFIGVFGEDEIVRWVKQKGDSIFAKDKHVMEGVVCRPKKLMLFRNGDPIMWKLKCKEF